MGGHRGDAALRLLAPVAIREIGIATVVGFVGGTAWYLFIRGNAHEWAAVNKAYQVKKVEKRKAYEAWLKAQPFDDEVA